MTLAIQPLFINQTNRFAYSVQLSSQKRQEKSDISFTGLKLPKINWQAVKKYSCRVSEWYSYIVGAMCLGAGLLVDINKKPHELALLLYGLAAWDFAQGLAVRFFGEKALTLLVEKPIKFLRKMIFRK